MVQPSFKYKVEIPLNTKISYSLLDSDLLEEGIVRLYESTAEQHTLFAKLSDLVPEMRYFLIETLILEKSFSEEQDLRELYQDSRKHISQYLYIIRYLTREDSATLVDRDAQVTTILNGREHQYRYREIFPLQSTGCIAEMPFLDRETFERLLSTPSIEFEKYVDIFVDTSNLRDPVARLIGFASLVELINEEVGSGTITIDALLQAARNLVAHGIVDRAATLNSLNSHFNTPNQTSHTFSRNNAKHMDLMAWAAREYHTHIEEFLARQIPARNISINVNPTPLT